MKITTVASIVLAMSIDGFHGSEKYVEFLQSNNVISCDIDSKTCEIFGRKNPLALKYPNKVKFELDNGGDTIFFDEVCFIGDLIASKALCPSEKRHTVIYYSQNNINPLSSVFDVSTNAIIAHELFHHFSKITLNPYNYNFVGNYASDKNSLLVRHSMLPNDAAYYSSQQAKFICKFLQSGDILNLEKSKHYYNQYKLDMGKLFNITREVQISETTASYLMFSYDNSKSIDLTANQFCSNLDEFLYNEHYTVLGHSYAIGFLAGTAMDKLTRKVDFSGDSDKSIVDELYDTIDIKPTRNDFYPYIKIKMKHFFIALYRRFTMSPSEAHLEDIVKREWENCLNNGGWHLEGNKNVKHLCQSPF
ncbi:hypothetical protein [Pseudoteredinibacter isoporae]|uniref:hypothetical protein n=1 Tax=Pseudoteredinibacter isoporae TaxID=570281 RepID=UPI003106C58A